MLLNIPIYHPLENPTHLTLMLFQVTMLNQQYIIDNFEKEDKANKKWWQWSETGKECGSQKNYGTLSGRTYVMKKRKRDVKEREIIDCNSE